MPKLTIDGRDIEVEPGTTVIRAADRLGIYVPHYCWHPGLSVAGNCRMCLVEVEKAPKLLTACSTAVADGMVVRTTGERVKEAQDAIMEFLLINHPLDCPICDEAGECRLQEYAFRYGPSGSRFQEEKTHKPKRVDLGRHIVFDAERCILCTRCVRFCSEVTETHELTVGNRGEHVEIETYPGMRLDNSYSGNTVDICPVGALTLKEFRFKQRVWFLKDVHSVCSGCARGCNVIDGVSKGRILRITPRTNLEVNRWWICDEGRLSFEKLYRPGRIVSARVGAKYAGDAAMTGEIGAVLPRESPEEALPAVPMLNEGVPPAPRPAAGQRAGDLPIGLALDAAALALDQARTQGGPGSVEFLLSSRATNEDIYAMGKLARDQFSARRVSLPDHERGEDDALLIRKDKTPNRAGAHAILGGLGLAIEPGAELVQRLRSGAAKAVVALGPNLVGIETETGRAEPGTGLFDEIAAAASSAGALLIGIDAFDSPLTARAPIVLPALTYGEIEGTVTNFEGRVQRVRAGLPPAADGLSVYRIAQEIGRRLGVQPVRGGAQETFSALAAEIPAFAGLSYAKVGDYGVSLAEPAGKTAPRAGGGA